MCRKKEAGGVSSGGEAAMNRKGAMNLGRESSPHTHGKEKAGSWWSWSGGTHSIFHGCGTVQSPQRAHPP